MKTLITILAITLLTACTSTTGSKKISESRVTNLKIFESNMQTVRESLGKPFYVYNVDNLILMNRTWDISMQTTNTSLPDETVQVWAYNKTQLRASSLNLIPLIGPIVGRGKGTRKSSKAMFAFNADKVLVYREFLGE